MKRFLLLALGTILNITGYAYDFESDGMYFNIISASDRTVSLTYKDENYNTYSGDVVIPGSVIYNDMLFTVENVDYRTFRECSNLKSITLPKGLKNFGTINTDWSVGGFYKTSVWDLYVPDMETFLNLNIAQWANPFNSNGSLFVNGELLVDAIVPEGIQKIRFDCFVGCQSLKTIKFSSSVRVIESQAFNYCKNISTLYLHDLGIWLNSQNFLPSQHLYIDGKEVTDIVIPNTVTSIGRVFENCEYVTSVHIPESVTEIENFAFSGCKALTSVNIPNSVTTIGENAFQVCSSLSSVTIPNSITKIDRRAFYGCKNLTEVHSLIENPFAISASTFLSYNSSTKSDYTTATLYVPKGTKSRYLSTEGWSNNFKAIEEMASGPESIKLPMMATVEVGKTITLEPEIKPDGATAVLTWESKDDKIARVKDGVVLGLKEGTTDIVVRTDNGLEDWCYVTVIDPSGIYDVSADEPASSAVFSLSGQRLSAPRKGLNIIGGKKVMVK